MTTTGAGSGFKEVGGKGKGLIQAVWHSIASPHPLSINWGPERARLGSGGPIKPSPPGNSLVSGLGFSCHLGDVTGTPVYSRGFLGLGHQELLDLAASAIPTLSPKPQWKVKATRLWVCPVPGSCGARQGIRAGQAGVAVVVRQGSTGATHLSIMALKSNTPSMSLAANLRNQSEEPIRDKKLGERSLVQNHLLGVKG